MKVQNFIFSLFENIDCIYLIIKLLRPISYYLWVYIGDL